MRDYKLPTVVLPVLVATFWTGFAARSCQADDHKDTPELAAEQPVGPPVHYVIGAGDVLEDTPEGDAHDHDKDDERGQFEHFGPPIAAGCRCC